MNGQLFEPIPHYYTLIPIPEPPMPYNDISPLCAGCPYPRHGLTCHDPNGRGCLRADMKVIEERSKAKRGAVQKRGRNQAAQVDLLTFLQSHRPADLIREGGSYRSKTYSSLWINNGVWTYYARDNPDRPDKKLAGRSALDFLIKVEGVPITDAIRHINGGSYIPTPAKPPRTPRPFALPAPAKNNDHARDS